MTRAALITAALGAATLLSRLPFASQRLWAWDSVLYARALEDGFHVDYALATQRPHPPGYVLYVGVASLFRSVVGDSNTALVLVSALGSALAVAALYLLARRFAGERAALVVALGFAVDPLVWQYSEIAYPYTVLAFMSVALASMFWVARTRGARATLVASVVFGAAAGFRQDLLLIVGPLWLWTLWPYGARIRVAALAALGTGCLVWFVPSALLSGGPLAYVDAVLHQANYVRDTYSVSDEGLAAFTTNLGTTLYALAWGLGAFAIPLLLLVQNDARRAFRERRLALGTVETFLVIWIVPALAFYVALHIGEWGYVLSVLPGLYVVAARGLEQAFASAAVVRSAALGAAVVAASAALFVAAPLPFSTAAVAQHDAELMARVSYVREHFPANRTLMLAREDFLLVRYYLPEYRAWLHDPDPYHVALHRKRTRNVNTIVVFTPGLVADKHVGARSLECAKGIRLVYLEVEPGAIVEFYGAGYSLTEDSR